MLAPAAVVFDLDGTLIDSRRDIATAVNRVRVELGFAPHSEEAVAGMVGEGVRLLLERALGPLAPQAFDRALRSYLAHYDAVCTDTTGLYAGMAEVVRSLKPRYPLAVLTNKPESMSRKILAALGLLDPFRLVVGGDTLPFRKPDPRALSSVAERLGFDVARTALVGDSAIDAATARSAGAPLVLVTWGFGGDRGRLAGEGADALCDRPADLLAALS